MNTDMTGDMSDMHDLPPLLMCEDPEKHFIGERATVDDPCPPTGCMPGFADKNKDLNDENVDGCECPQSTESDLPGDGDDSSCDGVDGDITKAIFVAPNGDDTRDGLTPQTSLKTLSKARDIAIANPMHEYILIAQGQYTGVNFELINGVSLYGGCDTVNCLCASAPSTTTIGGGGAGGSSLRSESGRPGAGGGGAGGCGATAATSAQSGGSSIALIAVKTKLNLVNTSIILGRAGSGGRGGKGGKGSLGTPGAPGSAASGDKCTALGPVFHGNGGQDGKGGNGGNGASGMGGCAGSLYGVVLDNDSVLNEEALLNLRATGGEPGGPGEGGPAPSDRSQPGQAGCVGISAQGVSRF